MSVYACAMRRPPEDNVVSSAISLRVCYAMRGTDTVYCAVSRVSAYAAPMQCSVLTQCISLCALYAISSTEITYAATSAPPYGIATRSEPYLPTRMPSDVRY
eukprot:3940308-Rhodomonas_salina.2